MNNCTVRAKQMPMRCVPCRQIRVNRTARGFPAVQAVGHETGDPDGFLYDARDEALREWSA